MHGEAGGDQVTRLPVALEEKGRSTLQTWSGEERIFIQALHKSQLLNGKLDFRQLLTEKDGVARLTSHKAVDED
jgi:hypothetical protein